MLSGAVEELERDAGEAFVPGVAVVGQKVVAEVLEDRLGLCESERRETGVHRGENLVGDDDRILAVG